MNEIDVMINREAIEIELNLISAILADNTLINELKIDERYFFDKFTKLVIKAMKQISNGNEEINIITLADKLGNNVKLSKLTQLVTNGELYKNVFGNLQNRVIKNTQKKQCLELAQYINEKLVSGEEPQNIFSHISKSINTAEIINENSYSIGEVMDATIDKIEINYNNYGKITGMETGYKQLDAILNGIEKKKYIIIGARPGKGKTAFSLELSRRLAVKNNILFFSLEMAKEELGERLISSVNSIQNYKVKTGKLTENEFNTMMNGIARISDLKFAVDDTESITVEELSRRAIRYKRKCGLDAIVVDYLTLLDTEEKYRDTREKINIISNKLRQISKKLDIAVICLAQLNRAVEGRANKIPNIADLRETGNIEQDANIILLLHSEENEGNTQANESAEELSVIVGKNRSGVSNKIIKFNYYKRTQIIDEKYK